MVVTHTLTVYCHVYTFINFAAPLPGKVSFIDFEYSAYNYEAYDIAVHFCEYCGKSTSIYLHFNSSSC